MSRLLKIAGLSALLLASSASAQVPGQHLVYSKTGYAPGPVTYHQQVIPGQVQYQQVPVQYQQQIIQTEKPVVYEAAVLPVVKGVDGAVQQQQYATAPAPSGYPAQQQIVQGQQYFQTQSGQYVQ